MAETRKGMVISTLERMPLSRTGNPRYRVTFTDGTSALTEADSQIGYKIENREYRNVPLDVTFGDKGAIAAITIVK